MNLKFWNRSSLSRLGKDKRTSGPGFLARFLRDEEGSYLLYMTIAIPVFIGFAAFASEGSLLLYNHRTLQSAADAAAYSAAIAYRNGDTTNAALTTQAEAIVAEYVKTSGWVIGTGNDKVSVTVRDPTSPGTPILNPYDNIAGMKAIQVNVSRPQLPILSGLWLKNPINVGGSAIAILSGGSGGGGGSGNCLLALGNNPKSGTNDLPDAIHVNGGGNAVNINVPGCGVYTDSTDCTNGSFSVDLGGNAKVVAGSLGSAGCIDVFGHANVTLSNGNYTQNGAVVPDPYAGTTLPTSTTAGSCNSTTGQCTPGVYSSGIQLKGAPKNTSSWTLQPGIYILNGAFDTGPGGKGGTIVTGNGVTLVFTSSSSSGGMNIDSNSNVTLTAPTSGPTDGFVMMGGPSMPLGTSFTTAANATVSMTGTMYLPNAALLWHGNPGTGSNQCLRAVVNSVLFNGDSGFSNVDCNDLYNGAGGGNPPPPPPLNVTLVN